jgi:hypothetical protein
MQLLQGGRFCHYCINNKSLLIIRHQYRYMEMVRSGHLHMEILLQE